MPLSRSDRRSAREPLVRAAIGEVPYSVLDLLELAEFAWHDCYGETSPPEAVISDIVTCAEGDLAVAVRAARLAVQDFRDLRLWADGVRSGGRLQVPFPRTPSAADTTAQDRQYVRMDDDMLGASRSLIDGEWSWPVHGLRHPPEGGSSGWYVWSGDLSDAPDFFQPWHSSHLIAAWPELAHLLLLPPGSRFLIAPDHEDVWEDPALLDTRA